MGILQENIDRTATRALRKSGELDNFDLTPEEARAYAELMVLKDLGVKAFVHGYGNLVALIDNRREHVSNSEAYMRVDEKIRRYFQEG